MNMQNRAKLDKARKLYDQYAQNIECVAGTIEHGIMWASKDILDKNNPDYIDETDAVEDNKVACALLEEALDQITKCAVELRYISCKERTLYFKTCINASVKLKAFKLAYNMARVASELPRDRTYFLSIMKKYKGRKDEDKNSVGVLDVRDFEVEYV